MKMTARALCLLIASGVVSIAQTVDRGEAYYNYSMGHIYSELAAEVGGRGDYVTQAADHLKAALKADPSATFIAEELADLYIQANAFTTGVSDAEAALAANPKDLNARRILGRIYMRLVGDQRTRTNETYLRQALEQYTKIVEAKPDDTDAWVTIGQIYKVQEKDSEAEKAFQKALTIKPDSEEAMTELALIYSEKGEGEKAAELLRKVAEKNPNPRALTYLAGTYEQMKDYAKAAETLQRVLTLVPENEELRRALAQNLTLAGKLDEAVKLYREFVEEDERDWQSQLRIAQIYRSQGKFPEARRELDKAKEISPDNPEVLFAEVGLLQAEGKTDEAIAALQRVLDSNAKRNYNPNERLVRAQLLEMLGQLYLDTEQYSLAVEIFREMGGLETSMATRSSLHVIRAYRQAKEYDKALREADGALKLWPEDRAVRLEHATTLAETCKLEQAVAEVKKLIDGKSDRETWLAIAGLYERGKKFSEMGKALDEADKLSKEKSEQESIAFMRGAMYEGMKNLDKAEAEFRKVLAASPDSAAALNYLGYMLADRNVRLPEAVDLIKKALVLEPNNGAYLDSLGWAYYRQGKSDEAIKYLKLAVADAASDPTVNDHLGDAYSKAGNLKEAVGYWEKAIKALAGTPACFMDSQEVSKVQKKIDTAKVQLAKEKN